MLAFPAPKHDADALAAKSPRVSATPAGADAAALTDGRFDTKLMFPGGAGMAGTAFTVEIELAEPIEARTLQVFPAVPQPLEIAGPWEVSFAPGRGAPEKVAFDSLTDWSQHDNPGIRYFSGAAVYRKSFTLDGSLKAAPGTRVMLDLGEVRDLATVKLNGREFTTLWLAPWRLDVTEALKAGMNELEIEIINPWNNRLAGDAKLPEEKRHTTLALATVTEKTPLMPAGLIGPVRLVFEHTLRIGAPGD